MDTPNSHIFVGGFAVIGAYPDGRPIYQMAGGDGTADQPVITPAPTANPLLDDTSSRVGELTARLKAAVDVMQEAKDEDGARWQKANEERETLAKDIHELKARQESEDRQKATEEAVESMKAMLESTRRPSKAGAVGGNVISSQHSALAGGSFIQAIGQLRGNDAEAQATGKATLASMGIKYEEAWGKATLGTTDATGGFIIPNNLVDELITPALYQNPYRSLLTVVPGVTGSGVDIPYRAALETRAVIAPIGDLKENKDLAYGGYTATMYTLARIYDLSNQFVRQSAGAAERDVMQELGNAFALGEAWYTINGTGTGMPYGLLTALTNAPATFTSSFTGSATTLAGSIATAIATAAGALATRDRSGGLSAVMSASSYWTMLSQGTDEAGFFFAPTGGPAAIAPGTLISPFGIPVYPDSQFAADDMIVGQFKALKEYLGASYRVDSSSVAGTRWDYNLTGYRGEMEMGLDARPAVYAGAFQIIADILP